MVLQIITKMNKQNKKQWKINDDKGKLIGGGRVEELSLKGDYLEGDMEHENEQMDSFISQEFL